jgi:hypothetical protein
MAFSSGVRFSTIKNVFSLGGDIETARGTSAEIRDYVGKFGKWENGEKGETKIEGTFEEWGELPQEHQGVSCEEIAVMERIQDGATNAEILFEFPHYFRALRDVDYVRQTLRAELFRDKWRTIETVYIWGGTGIGKTRYVMDGCGYANVYAVNNYKNPFDGYAGENVMLFDEFSGSIPIPMMNTYLDGYPLSLPARYNNKVAYYEKVFIVSNVDLREQYKREQAEQPEIWAAFLRRINKVIHFLPDGSRQKYESEDYISLW